MRTIVRALMLAAAILFFHVAVFSQQVAKQIPYPGSPEGLIGFLEFKPSDYGTQKHPLIIFLHGIGERGNGTSQLGIVAANAIPMYCSRGASMRFTVGGQTSSFVVLSPQLSTAYGYWPTYYIKEMLKYAKANLQIDPDRIYVTGLSLGGGAVWRYITDTEGFNYTQDAGIAAAAPVCGTQEENDFDFCATVGANHLPIWAFHSMDDGMVWVGSTQHAEALSIACGVTPASKFTYYQTGNHGGAWINAYDTGHITRAVNVNGVVSNFTANPNLYEWFLSQKRNTGAPPVNTPPLANAGNAQIISLPLNTVTLTGSGTGTNGATIASYSWAKTSGPDGGIIALPLLNTSLVTGLVAGTYVFALTVTDNHGLSSSSNVTVTVNPLLNQGPVANAGTNTAITLPVNYTTLDGSGSTDPDGTIASYWWSKTSGPDSYTIDNATTASAAISNLSPGTYVFALQVTDNAGAKAWSSVTVTVNDAASNLNNQSPIASAGFDKTITLPVNSLGLDGSASFDPDGNIAAYYWYQTSGPSTYSIADPNAARTTVNNLGEGVYKFTLQVKDNAGASSFSTVTIIVTPENNQPPVANAGSEIVVTLPASTATLDGSASYDPDGSIAAYYWVQNSGPSTAAIADPSSVKTAISNLVQGVYSFTLQVRDNNAIISFGSVTVTVNPPGSPVVPPPPAPPVAPPNNGPNQPPVSNAGTDIAISLPVNSVTLDATASYDPDGTIVEYYWIQNSGPAAINIANIADIRSSKTTLSNLIQGVYIFTLQVKDNSGATGYSMKTVTVSPATAAPTPPASHGNNLLGYIKLSYGPNFACADASSDGRIPVYGSTIANGSVVYADEALTQPYNGGWNWFSFTPALGGPVTQAFAIYPVGSIGLLTPCSAGLRTTTASGQAIFDITTSGTEIPAAAAGKLSMYPNPVRTVATVELTSADNSVKIIYVYNASGILKAKYTWQTIKGNNTFSLKNIAGLASGLYVLDIRDSNGKPNGKVKFIKM